MKKGEVIIDGQNVAEIQHLGISLMAVEDKIIVMFDEYKSGYECKICKGKGFIEGCPVCEGSGKDRFGQECKTCLGKTDFKYLCQDCRGKGGILFIPETARSLPTTGIVLSMGPGTPAMKYITYYRWTHWFRLLDKYWRKKLNEVPIRLGARVIFGPHVGTLIPFKGNIKLKIMRVHEPLAVLFGKDTASRDFIDYEVETY